LKTNHRVTAILAGCAIAFAGCSSSGSSPPANGSGGQSSSSGGNSGSGGNSSGSGGKGSGGSSSSGGTQGSGGKVGSGGSNAGSGGQSAGSGGAASGGSNGSGGAAQSGGATGGGGKSGSGGAAGGATGSGGGGPAGGATGSGGGGTPSGVTVKLDATHQMIEGFGLNDALIGTSLPLDNLFTTTGADAIGLSILRIGMDSSGGLAGTMQSNIDGVKSRGGKIIGSCWSPPANCKSNMSTKDGGSTNTSCYGSWSDTIAAFAKKYGLYAMSIANEPDFASCGDNEPCNGSYDTTTYTANQMVAFLKVAGPKLQANNVKVIAPEASEWIHFWSNLSATGSVPSNKNSSDPLKCGCFGNSTSASTTSCAATCSMGNGYDYGHFMAKDADAWKAVDILGVHEYDTQHAEPWPSDVNNGKPNKEVWQTEMSGVKWWPEQGTGTGSSLKGSDTIANGVAVAGWIHSALTVGEASAWLWWWYTALNTDDNEGLLVKGSSKLTRRYYTLGNYSKFVRPGYTMVEVAGNSNTDVLLSAFKGTDGVVVVAINKGSADATVPISFSGGTAPASCTPNVTSATDNLAAKPAVTVTGGVLSAALPTMTVTSFVCK